MASVFQSTHKRETFQIMPLQVLDASGNSEFSMEVWGGLCAGFCWMDVFFKPQMQHMSMTLFSNCRRVGEDATQNDSRGGNSSKHCSLQAPRTCVQLLPCVCVKFTHLPRFLELHIIIMWWSIKCISLFLRCLRRIGITDFSQTSKDVF